jgi:hypothetical protein
VETVVTPRDIKVSKIIMKLTCEGILRASKYCKLELIPHIILDDPQLETKIISYLEKEEL